MEFMSESSTDGKSFGLLDENLLQDITLSTNSNENKITTATKVKEKPPIPQTTRKKSLNNNSNLQQPVEFNELAYEQQNADPAEETAVSIKLNESDLKQLDDEFTFADSDEDDEKEHKETDQTLNRNSPVKNKNDVFSMIFNKDAFKNELILNESADILRNSNEFFKTKPMNYDMSTNHDESKLASTNMSDVTLNQVINSTSNDHANLTLNFANETAAKNRMNELVQQSIERIKRRVYGSFADIDSNDDYFANLNTSTNPTKEMLSNKQFSPASHIKPTKLYNMSTTSNFEENNLTEHANQTISFAAASVDLNPVESLKDTTLKDSSAASMSIYFKPQQEDLNETPTNQPKEEEFSHQQQQATFILNEDAFGVNNASEDSMFAPTNKNLVDFNLNDQANFKEFNEINSIEFKSGADAFNCINEDEAENRMLETSADQTNDTSSSDTSHKWWKKQEQQKLEQSKAQDYFEVNSTLPSFLANKDSDTTYSLLKRDAKKTLEPVQDSANETTLSDEKQLVAHDSDEITFSTTKNQLSDNFSFTLNASENGDFIVKKSQNETKANTTPFQVTKMLNAYQQKKATASNLKTIGEELDRVSNRLAISNDSILKTTTITTAMTTTTTTSDKSLKHKNNQLILTMDETISSINSSSNRTANLVKQQQSKKLASGSLTSTPSKHNKKAEKSSLKKEDQTEITSTTSNNLLNQASFISSIPERTNDSTLVGNLHHNHKAKRSVSKHAEIQTSPDKTSSSSSSSTASFSSDAPTKLAEEKTQNNVLASQMVAINNLAASLLNNNNNNNTNELNSNRTSLFNSSNNNGLIPVAFLPVDAVFPYVQKIYDNYQQKSQIDLSSNSMRQQSLFADLNNTSKLKLELPTLELDKSEIDFGQIAEGCAETVRLCVKLANTSLIQFNREHNVSAQLHVELRDEDWSFEQNKLSLDDPGAKLKLTKTLTVCADKKQTSNSKLKLDFVTNYYEFYISLNTTGVSYFKDLIYHQQVDSRSNINELGEHDKSLNPLNIHTKLSIYYSCVENTSQNNKYLLNHVGLKYTLGYAKLRSAVNLSLIEFDLAPLYYSDSNNKSILSCRSNADGDKTLTSNCSKDDTSVSMMSTKNLVDQLIPLSNGGNIPINVNCYFVEDNDKPVDEQPKHRMLSLKDNQFQLKIDKSILTLDAVGIDNKTKTSADAVKKQFARLTLLKLSHSEQIVSFDDLALRLILQIKPNGFKYEIPIRFKISKQTQIPSVSKLKKVASLDSNTSNVNAKIASSKSIIFFGKTLNSNIKSNSLVMDTGLVNEFLIRNLNDFKVKYELTVCTCVNDVMKPDEQLSINMSTTSASSFSTSLNSDKLINKSSINLFKFTSEMREFAPKEDQSMTRLVIQVDPKEHASISVKFNSSLVEFTDSKASSQMSSSCYGLIKIATLGFNQKFNVFLVGFLNKSQLCLDTNENRLVKKSELTDESSKLERHVCNKNIQLFNFKYHLTSSVCDDNVCLFRKTIKLCNKSSTSRLIVYPAVFDLQRELNSTRNENQLVFDLDLANESYTTKFKLESKLNESASISWIDLAPNEQVNLNLDVEFKIINTKRKLSDLYERIERRFSQLNVCLFWIEYDINMQCLNGAQFLQDMSTSSIESHVDVFVKKLLSLNPRSFNTKLDPNFVNSVITKRAKLQFDNLVCLMSQALKCSNLKLTLAFNNDHSIETSLLNESTLSLNETRSSKFRDDSWSILTEKIVFSNLNFDQVTNYTAKLTIRNNLPRTQLIFNTAYNATVLDVEPNRGAIPPHKTLDLIVRARRDGVKKLPWDGKIVVISNKSEKEIPVWLYSSLAPTKLNNSKSFSESKLFKPPPPIPSFSLPTLSVKSKLNDQLSKNSSSFSLSDSSPFVLSSTSASSTEQGTVISEITQNTIDSLSLTPLINASFHMHSSKLQQQRTLKADESSIKILHFGNHAQIQFPPVCVNKSKTYDFTLINPTGNFVNWRACAASNQQLNSSNDSTSLSTKSSSNVFRMTPSSGVIPANQKQIIKIEFSPRDECGNFQELWEIDTRASSPISYNCKIVISGRSILNEEDSLNVLTENNNSQTTRPFKSTTSLAKCKSKENFEPFRKDDSALTTKPHQKTLSDYNQSMESNRSCLDVDCHSISANSVSDRKITFKYEKIEFPDTPAGSKSKSFIIIDNKDDKRCNLNIIPPMDPFYCKHLTISIESRHYIKVPIEFKPRVPGDYTEKILIRIDSTDVPLTCLLKAKCVHSI